MSLRSQFFAFDDRLAKHGVPPLTAWWRGGVGAWLDSYEAGGALELWACVGRGAAKSTVVYRLALFFALLGDFAIPAGERHFAVVLSRLKEEAGKGVVIIASWLTLLRVAHRVAGDVIELVDMPRGIRVVAASVGAASGWRAFFVACDEFSKWAMGGGAETLDASEVRTSAVAMTATHPRAPVVTGGSAWGAFGTFYDAITTGTDASKVVLGPAATWIAAPHIREEDTRAKERDPRRWAREYACEFQAGGAGAFDVDVIDRAFATRSVPPSVIAGQPLIIIDASSGRSDSWTWCSARWLVPPSAQFRMVQKYVQGSATCGTPAYVWEYATDPKGQRIELEPEEHFAATVQISWIKSVDGAFWKQVSADAIAARIAQDALEAGAARIVGDQREAFALSSLFASRRVAFTSIPWSNPSKVSAIETLRRWMRDGQLMLPGDLPLRRELVEFEEKILPSGAVTFGARGNRHDDRVALLVTCAMAETAGLLNMSPYVRRQYRDLRNLPPA